MKVAINGFGRIGRLFFKQAEDAGAFEITAVNDLGNIDNLAYLLAHDTVYKKWDAPVEVDAGKNMLIVGGKEVKVFSEREIADLPWGDLDIDIVVEATGVFTTFEKARAHRDVAGAKRVVITAPAKDAEADDARTVLNGVNEHLFKTCAVTSNGSCTTNSASPVVTVLSEALGIEKAMLTTIHGYTATQKIVDGPDKKDWRRGRAAAQNIIPSTTGAAIAVARAVEALKDKFDGIAMRVPVPAGSASDITMVTREPTTPLEVNTILANAAKTDRWRGILKVTDDELVSTDILGEPYGAIVDAKMTHVVGGNLVKVLSWYDNEWGYVHTLVQHVRKFGEAIQ